MQKKCIEFKKWGGGEGKRAESMTEGLKKYLK